MNGDIELATCSSRYMIGGSDGHYDLGAFLGKLGCRAFGRTDHAAAVRPLRFEVGDWPRTSPLRWEERLSSEAETTLHSLCTDSVMLSAELLCSAIGVIERGISRIVASSSSTLFAALSLMRLRAYSKSL